MLSESQILVWADAHFARFKKWPNLSSGHISETVDDTWRRVDKALRLGYRGLRGGDSLARFLKRHRGVRHRLELPSLSPQQILEWADAFFARKKRWPTQHCGPIADAPGETWKAINHALRLGYRGLAGDSSLAELLRENRGVRNIQNLPRLTVHRILAWARAFHRRTGKWPTDSSGAIPETAGETWKAVQMALVKGCRGLPGGSSLHRLIHHLQLISVIRRKEIGEDKPVRS